MTATTPNLALPPQVRVSLGSAIVLGLSEGKLDAAPTTVYLMTHRQGKCGANCGFCSQARSSKSSTELLSRVTWPTYSTLTILAALPNVVAEGKIRRVCIQALNYPAVFDELEALVKKIKQCVTVEVSVSCQPQSRQNMERLKASGVDRLGIALDAATEAIFDRVKGKDIGGNYSWSEQFRLMAEALQVFGRGNVSTHVIVGLGETEQQAVEVLDRCLRLGVLPGLFAFTPVRGTALEASLPPRLDTYRRVQVARYLLVNKKAKLADMRFDTEGKIIGFGVPLEVLDALIESGAPFRTSGCPDCNRPYYNEKPSGPIYNYPTKLTQKEVETAKKELLKV
ncbi:MAG: radical SAM protein [Candidatus Bathyarchaeota archaeon]|nr:radical SAM protein [Candidatus Bathyarchaeota archaeon]